LGDGFALLGFGPDGWGDELAAGAWLTIRLALATLPFGLAVGLLAALARNSKRRWLRVAGNIFTTLFRGLPELLTLLIVYFGGQMLITRIAGMFGEDVTIEVSAFVAGLGVFLTLVGSQLRRAGGE